MKFSLSKWLFEPALLSDCFTYWNIYCNGCHSNFNKIILF